MRLPVPEFLLCVVFGRGLAKRLAPSEGSLEAKGPGSASPQGSRYFARLVCSETEMEVSVGTRDGSPFTGVVFTDGSYGQDGCFQKHKDGPATFVFRIPYDGCKTQRTSGQWRNTLVVQRHERIMTGQDAAFTLACSLESPRAAVVLHADQDPQLIRPQMVVTGKRRGKEAVEEEEAPAPSLERTEWSGRSMTDHLAHKKAKTLYDDKATFTYMPAKNSSVLINTAAHAQF